MTTRRLKISPDLTLPLDAVTETFAILAVRGAGKSNAAVTMAEEMHKAGLPWVAIDPKGDWWGIRSSADGKGPGLPVALFGAPGRKRRNKPEPDLPLEDTAGKLIADLVVDERISCILDMAGFTEAAKIRFLIDFGTRLFERNEEPLHLFLEECDDYMPQKPFKEQTRLLHIYTKILKQARSFGIGASLVSQRSAVVNKNALTQCQTLIALRTTSPQDRAAIELWVKEKGGQHLEIVDSLPSLKDGEAWVWSPDFLGKVERMRFHKRETFDSGATPKVGAKHNQPKTVADIDLGALQARMSETIERAKAEDPKELRRQLAAGRKQIQVLERKLESAATESREVEVPVEVPVPLLEPRDVDRLQDILEGFGKMSDRLGEGASELAGVASSFREHLSKVRSEPSDTHRARPSARPPVRREPERGPSPRAARTASSRGAQPSVPTDLSEYAMGLLESLARQHPMRLTRSQVAMFAKRSHRSSAFSSAMVEIMRGGYVEQVGSQFELTDEGWDVVGDAPRTPMSAEEARGEWLRNLPDYESDLLAVFFGAYPGGATRDTLSEETGRSRTSSAFSAAIQTLKRNDLIEADGDELRARAWLFEEPS